LRRVYEEDALGDPEVDHRSSESAAVVLPSQTELILGLRAEQVRSIEDMALLASPVLKIFLRPPIRDQEVGGSSPLAPTTITQDWWN
jgi:hypothetical protein